MKRNKTAIVLFLILTLMLATLSGCGDGNNTVETCVISTEQYTEKDSLENASQPEYFEVGQGIYASVYFIESPLGMEYTGKWYVDGNEVKTETREMSTDKSGIIIFSLEADKVTTGTVKFEIVYDDDVLFTSELTVK